MVILDGMELVMHFFTQREQYIPQVVLFLSLITPILQTIHIAYFLFQQKIMDSLL